MQNVLTWREVANLIRPRGRGAPKRLSDALGMDSSDFYRRLKRGTGELRESEARIVRAFINDNDPPSAARAAPASAGPSAERLPVYGYAAASDGDRITLNDGSELETYELPMGLALGPGDYFVVRPLGSSMEPRIFPGETLVVRRGYPPGRGTDVVIEFRDGSALVKTYKGQRDGRIFVEQFNEPKILDFEATTVKALHAVVIKL